jgi:hypothetical protein
MQVPPLRGTHRGSNQQERARRYDQLDGPLRTKRRGKRSRTVRPLHLPSPVVMAGGVVFRHRNFRTATVYVDGARTFSGPYKDGVHLYEIKARRLRHIRTLKCVACGAEFDRPLYHFKLTCSVPCKIRHVRALNKKST